jgi:hypothetical protein
MALRCREKSPGALTSTDTTERRLGPKLVGYRPVLKSWRPGQADELG